MLPRIFAVLSVSALVSVSVSSGCGYGEDDGPESSDFSVNLLASLGRFKRAAEEERKACKQGDKQPLTRYVQQLKKSMLWCTKVFIFLCWGEGQEHTKQSSIYGSTVRKQYVVPIFDTMSAISWTPELAKSINSSGNDFFFCLVMAHEGHNATETFFCLSYLLLPPSAYYIHRQIKAFLSVYPPFGCW